MRHTVLFCTLGVTTFLFVQSSSLAQGVRKPDDSVRNPQAAQAKSWQQVDQINKDADHVRSGTGATTTPAAQQPSSPAQQSVSPSKQTVNVLSRTIATRPAYKPKNKPPKPEAEEPPGKR